MALIDIEYPQTEAKWTLGFPSSSLMGLKYPDGDVVAGLSALLIWFSPLSQITGCFMHILPDDLCLVVEKLYIMNSDRTMYTNCTSFSCYCYRLSLAFDSKAIPLLSHRP